MKRVLLVASVISLTLAACGGESRSTPNPTTTAIFEEQRAILAETREAEWTATSVARPTETPTPIRTTATPRPTDTPRPPTPPTPVDLAGDVTDLIALMPALAQFPD
ncbi:MAG: hypothetical protein ACRD1H_12350, partial [Vicinamibacterales bacterium]